MVTKECPSENGMTLKTRLSICKKQHTYNDIKFTNLVPSINKQFYVFTNNRL